MEITVTINDYLSKVVECDEDFGEKVMSLLNDYEDGTWRDSMFHDFLWNNVSETALTEEERKSLIGKPSSLLKNAAKKLKESTSGRDSGEGGEIAEILLYGILKKYHKAIPVVPKIFNKQNSRDYAKGADSVHIVLSSDKKDFTLWFGEAKFYKDIKNASLPSIIKSVGNSLETIKLKKENSIIVHSKDMDNLIDDPSIVEKIRETLKLGASMDTINPRLNIPILLLHECQITSSYTSLSTEYIDEIRSHHLERATTYFQKQHSKLKDKVGLYDKISFHLIIFPVPDKKKIVSKFFETLNFFVHV